MEAAEQEAAVEDEAGVKAEEQAARGECQRGGGSRVEAAEEEAARGGGSRVEAAEEAADGGSRGGGSRGGGSRGGGKVEAAEQEAARVKAAEQEQTSSSVKAAEEEAARLKVSAEQVQDDLSRIKSQAENVDPSPVAHEDDDEPWECENGCGFKHMDFEAVDQHERSCTFQGASAEDSPTPAHSGESGGQSWSQWASSQFQVADNQLESMLQTAANKLVAESGTQQSDSQLPATSTEGEVADDKATGAMPSPEPEEQEATSEVSRSSPLHEQVAEL